MAWILNVGGIESNWLFPDKAVEFIKEQMNEGSKNGRGFWIQVGDQAAEGSQMLFWTPGTPALFTRAENDPRELNYIFETGTDLPGH